MIRSVGISVIQFVVVKNKTNSSEKEEEEEEEEEEEVEEEEKMEQLTQFLCNNIFKSDKNICEISHFQKRLFTVSSSWPQNVHKVGTFPPVCVVGYRAVFV